MNARWPIAILLVLALPGTAAAALERFSPIEEVLPGVSHVIRLKLPGMRDGSCEVLRIYRMVKHVRRFGVKRFEDLILHELEHGSYNWRNRTVLLYVAKVVDDDLYRRSCAVLVALAKRQTHDEGLAARWALERNGEKKLVKEIKKFHRDRDD